MRTLEPEITNDARRSILRVVETDPGIHLRGIERATRLPLGQVLYHLDRLERMDLVVSARDSGFRRYYDAATVSWQEKPILAALRHGVPRRILLTLLQRPGLSHKELLAVAGVAGSTLTFHLQRLLASGVLSRSDPGPASEPARYRVAAPALATRVLAYHRASLRDPDVDRFVRAALERAFAH